jgi:hypothetical protein
LTFLIPLTLPAKPVAVLVEEFLNLCRILGKSVATSKAGEKPGPGEESDERLPMTNDKFSTTDSQSRSSKS